MRTDRRKKNWANIVKTPTACWAKAFGQIVYIAHSPVAVIPAIGTVYARLYASPNIHTNTIETSTFSFKLDERQPNNVQMSLPQGYM